MMHSQAKVEVSELGVVEAHNVCGPSGVVFDPGEEKIGLEGQARVEFSEEPGVVEAQHVFGPSGVLFDPGDEKIGQGEEGSDYLFHLEVNAHLERVNKLLAGC